MFDIYDNNWHFINSEIMKELENIYNQINNEKGFFPSEENVLRFLKFDFNKLKYIIVGMEPYPSSFCIDDEKKTFYPEATGRSFEVASINSWQQKFKQSSLRNILKTIYFNETGEIKKLEEIRQEIENGDFKILQPHQWFDSLEEQGVLFLNATLTVEPNNVGTHTKLWNNFMEELIKHINEDSSAKWLLWGNDAKNRVYDLVSHDNCILSCHPRLANFVYDNCFQYAKDIDWKGRI